MHLIVLSAVLLGTPVSWIERPITAPGRRIEVELDVDAHPDDMGEWLGADLRASYGLSDRFEIGVRILTAPVYPSWCFECSRFGGVVAEGQYRLARVLALTFELGYARPEGIPFLRYVPPRYQYYSTLISVGTGLSFRARVGGPVAVSAAPRIDIQSGSGAGESDFGAVYTFQVPVAVHVQVNRELVAHFETGGWAVRNTGGGGDWDRGVLAIVGLDYALDSELDLGLAAGSYAVDALSREALYLGVSATWRNR